MNIDQSPIYSTLLESFFLDPKELSESMDIAVIGVTPSGLISEWSKGAEAIYGHQPREVIGRPTTVLVPPSQSDTIPQTLASIDKVKKIVPVEAKHIRKDGTVIDTLLAITPTKDSFNNNTGATIIARDITEPKQAEVAKAYLAAIVDSSEAAIYGTTLDGMISTWNHGAERTFGYTHSEIMGEPLRRLFPSSLHNEVAELLTKIGQGEKRGRHDMALVRKDGTLVDVAVSLSPVTDSAGRIIGTSAIAHDITELKRMETALHDSKEFLEALFHHAPDALFVVDSEGLLFCVNEQAEALFGYSKEELLGKPIEVLMPERFRERHVAHRQGYSRAPKVRSMGAGLDLYAQRKDGSEFPVDIMLSPITTSKGQMVLAAARDITEKKRTEAAQEEAHKQLALSNKELLERSEGQVNLLNKALKEDVQRLESLTLQLAQARDAALQASTLKSVFIANVSHELRTPLAGIIASLELLLAQSASLDTEDLDLLATALSQAQSLLAIINDILDLARIEAGKFSVDQFPFSPSALLQETIRMFKDEARAKGLLLSIDIDPRVPDEVSGDRRRIRQVLVNLIGNAMKFTYSGEVCVKLCDAQRIDEETIAITFAVSDTGIGISEENQKLLFQPFSQVDTSITRQYGGAGLGLALSQSLVELMGGILSLESKEGVGSTFSFTIPFRSGAPSTSSAESTQAVGLEGTFHDKRVLVVEDNLVIQKLTVKQLLLLGLKAQGVSSGKEALDVERCSHFDLILMDCHLPDISGFDVTKQIRTLEASTSDHIPIIAMTAGAMTGDRETCLSAGMDDYLSKPISMTQLRATLQKWLVPRE